MKKIIKSLLRFINKDCFNLYLKIIYRWQVRNKFLNSNDDITRKYKDEVKRYWCKYKIKVNTNWHKWYSSRNGLSDVRYIPEDIYYCYIEPFYNRAEFKQAYADKGLHNVWFPNVKRPKVIAKNIGGQYYDDLLNPMSYEEVIMICKGHDRLIIKANIESGGGRNIYFIEKKDELIEKINIAITDLKKDFIIQEVVEQHKHLKSLNLKSVNTLRIISFYWKNKVHILSSEIRTGLDIERISNQTEGGIACGINQKGILNKNAYDKYGISYEKHPNGFVFKDSIVPSYQNVLEIIKKEHIKFGHFRLISWDFTIDSEGTPILIEHNLGFQGINSHQLNNGPLFGDLTDEILEEVFERC